MRNRKPSGCLPACLPACGGFTAPAGAGVQAPSRFSPGILAATSGRGREIQAEANPPTLTKRKKKKATSFQVEEYDGLAAERAVTVGSVQEETGSSR